jgi:DNA-directed RNA polymerase specialized sigma24 family protein
MDAFATGRVDIEASPMRFDEFFEAEYTRLFQSLLVITRDSAEAEDLAQEAMARAVERWDVVTQADHPAA